MRREIEIQRTDQPLGERLKSHYGFNNKIVIPAIEPHAESRMENSAGVKENRVYDRHLSDQRTTDILTRTPRNLVIQPSAKNSSGHESLALCLPFNSFLSD
jgi:hypothetical protein